MAAVTPQTTSARSSSVSVIASQRSSSLGSVARTGSGAGCGLGAGLGVGAGEGVGAGVGVGEGVGEGEGVGAGEASHMLQTSVVSAARGPPIESRLSQPGKSSCFDGSGMTTFAIAMTWGSSRRGTTFISNWMMRVICSNRFMLHLGREDGGLVRPCDGRASIDKESLITRCRYPSNINPRAVANALHDVNARNGDELDASKGPRAPSTLKK